MTRDLNTCSSQSAMHHGVRVAYSFVGAPTTAETTAAAHLVVTTYTFLSYFIILLYY